MPTLPLKSSINWRKPIEMLSWLSSMRFNITHTRLLPKGGEGEWSGANGDAIHNSLAVNSLQTRFWNVPFCDAKAKLLYNSLIISTYEIGKRKRVTIWLLLKFPELPWFAVISNNSCYWCKDKQNVLYDQRKTYFFLSGRLFCCHFDGLIVLLKSFSSSAETSYALSS